MAKKHQKGSHFIENGVNDFLQDNPYNLKVEIIGFGNS